MATKETNPKIDAIPDKELLLKRLKRWALEYLTKNAEIAKLEEGKKSLRDDCLAVLDRVLDKQQETQSIPFTLDDGRTLSVLRYKHHDTTWDIKGLAKVLRERGLEKRVLKIVVDEQALRKAVERGLVGLDEIEPHGKVESSWRFRPSFLKAEEE